jgi:hypothetical protein
LLTLDQVATELQRTPTGEVRAFWAIDPATIEIAMPHVTREYGVAYVQMINQIPYTTSGTKDLIVQYMNARTDIERAGYGYSVTEQAIDLITSAINTFAFNAGYFTENKLPRGMLLLNGDADSDDTELIEEYIANLMSGTPSSQWKIPIVPSGKDKSNESAGRKLEWVSFDNKNNEMQFQEWYDLQLSAIAAMYGASLEDLGIHSQKTAPLIGNDQTGKITASKTQVLGDTLAFLQKHFNKILDEVDSRYEFEFIGYEIDDPKTQRELDKTDVETIVALNEKRIEKGLNPIDITKIKNPADLPLNVHVVQMWTALQAQGSGGGGFPPDTGGDEGEAEEGAADAEWGGFGGDAESPEEQGAETAEVEKAQEGKEVYLPPQPVPTAKELPEPTPFELSVEWGDLELPKEPIKKEELPVDDAAEWESAERLDQYDPPLPSETAEETIKRANDTPPPKAPEIVDFADIFPDDPQEEPEPPEEELDFSTVETPESADFIVEDAPLDEREWERLETEYALRKHPEMKLALGMAAIAAAADANKKKKKKDEEGEGLNKSQGKPHDHKQEPYLYPVQQELADKWLNFYSGILDAVYKKTCKVFGLPAGNDKLSKADADPIRYNGKIVYNPDTGQPINQAQLRAFIKAIEGFINGKTEDAAKQFTFDNVAIQKIIRHLAKTSTTAEMRGFKLDSIAVNGHNFDWIAKDFQNMRTALGGAVSGYAAAQYQTGMDYLAQKIVGIDDAVRNQIKDTLLWNIRNGASKQQTAQDLFHAFGALNKDWQRVADTEAVNTQNMAYIKQLQADNAGNPVYLQRYELPGACPTCEKFNGAVALYSDKPLPGFKGDGTAKYAVWEGQETNGKGLVMGTIHPRCRGSWIEYDPGMDAPTAADAEIQRKDSAWDAAVKQARAENPELYHNSKEMYGKITEIYKNLLGDKEDDERLKKAQADFDESKHARAGDGKFTNGGGGDARKEYRDVSTEKAKELTSKDFGTPEEIMQIAKPIRTAATREEAAKYLDEIASKGELESKNGLKATISGKSKKEMLSGKSAHKSFNEAAHYQAIANADKLFSNAIEPWQFELDAGKNNKDLESRKFLYAPMEFRDKIVPVKFTVFEYKRPQGNRRLYSLEAIDVELDAKKEDAGMLGPTHLEKSSKRDTPSKTSSANNISHIFDSVNERLAKSLTYSGHKLAGRRRFAGFDISIENKNGSVRSGADKDGHEWRTKMRCDYGYIRGTEGVDGDHVDCYVGGDEAAKNAYIVHQHDPVTGKYDEDKVMLGFPTLEDAKKAYRKQYDRPGFMGDITAMPVDEFREKVLSKKYHGKMVKSQGAANGN